MTSRGWPAFDAEHGEDRAHRQRRQRRFAGAAYETDDAECTFFERLFAAAPHDPEVLRAVVDVAGVFRRIGGRLARRPDIVRRIDAVGELPLAPGPTHRQFEALIDGARW